jgi:ATP:corrinoid adenosyltransferase
LKSASAERFNSLTEYSELEVESWLVSYVNKNEDIEDTLHQLSIDFRDLESSLFDIKVRQEIIVAPMRDYIENWLKNALTKITKPDQEEVVATGQRIPKENTKGPQQADNTERNPSQ